MTLLKHRLSSQPVPRRQLWALYLLTVPYPFSVSSLFLILYPVKDPCLPPHSAVFWTLGDRKCPLRGILKFVSPTWSSLIIFNNYKEQNQGKVSCNKAWVEGQEIGGGRGPTGKYMLSSRQYKTDQQTIWMSREHPLPCPKAWVVQRPFLFWVSECPARGCNAWSRYQRSLQVVAL